MLSWILGILAVIIVLFGLLYWSGMRFTPEKIARNAARTMLSSFYSVEKAHPDTDKEELYAIVLRSRPTCRDETAVQQILNDARETAHEMKQPVRLWMITLWVVMREYHSYRSRMSGVPGNIPHALEFYERFSTSIRQVIPEDI